MEANFFDSRVFLKTAALRQVDADLPILRLAAAGCGACAAVRSYEPPMSVIGITRTSGDVRFCAAIGSIADVRLASSDDRL